MRKPAKTGSFKIRGAANKIAALIERGDVQSVVASSAGNHAQGVAYAAKRSGIPATIVMPAAAPIAKVQATEGYGAKVVLHGDCYDDAYAKAMEICAQEHATFLHPYNDLEVMAGQGTIGLEILRELPTVDTIVVPAGGGGLLAGVAACVKQVNPRVRVIGVQAEGADAISRSFHEGRYVATDTVSTIADGIAVKCPGDQTVELIRRYADDVVTVSDMEISGAILLLLERTKQLVEPAGATPLAACLAGKLDTKGKRSCASSPAATSTSASCTAFWSRASSRAGGACASRRSCPTSPARSATCFCSSPAWARTFSPSSTTNSRPSSARTTRSCTSPARSAARRTGRLC